LEGSQTGSGKARESITFSQGLTTCFGITGKLLDTYRYLAEITAILDAVKVRMKRTAATISAKSASEMAMGVTVVAVVVEEVVIGLV